MKFFYLLFCLVCSISYTYGRADKFKEDIINKIIEYTPICEEETHPTDEDLAKLLLRKVPETRTGRCMLFCIYRRFHLQNDDGSFDKEGTLKTLEPLKNEDPKIYDSIMTVTKNCWKKVVMESHPCDSTGNIGNCINEENKALNLSEEESLF